MAKNFLVLPLQGNGALYSGHEYWIRIRMADWMTLASLGVNAITWKGPWKGQANLCAFSLFTQLTAASFQVLCSTLLCFTWPLQHSVFLSIANHVLVSIVGSRDFVAWGVSLLGQCVLKHR